MAVDRRRGSDDLQLLIGVAALPPVPKRRPLWPTRAVTQRRHCDIGSRERWPSGLIDNSIERLEGLIEPLLAAAVLLVVSLCGNVAKQLLQVVLPGGQRGAVRVIGEACSKHDPFAGGVDET